MDVSYVMKEIELNPLDPKRYDASVKLLVAIASSEPDFKDSKAYLNEIYSNIENDEKIAISLLDAIRAAKSHVQKEINNRIIDEHLLAYKINTQA